MNLGYLITYDAGNMKYESIYAILNLNGFNECYAEAKNMYNSFYIENHFNTSYFYKNKRFEYINDIINMSNEFKQKLHNISDFELYDNIFNTDLDFKDNISIRFDIEQYENDLKYFDMYEKHTELFMYYDGYDILKKFDIIAPIDIEKACIALEVA
jgi:hypothetical protein